MRDRHYGFGRAQQIGAIEHLRVAISPVRIALAGTAVDLCDVPQDARRNFSSL